MNREEIAVYLESALAARSDFFDEKHEAAFRLYNGFYEGCPDVAVDLYAESLVIHNYADDPADGLPLVEAAREYYLKQLPWLQTVIVKTRNAESQEARRGQIVYGEKPDRKIREHGIWYSVDLMMNRDASLYLDTRHLRKWAIDKLAGKTVLNTFAYTGSLGVAAIGAGAKRVVHLDLNRKFLNVAKTSYTLNGFPIDKKDFISGDFFPGVSRMKRAGALFDCVFIDPPFFASTDKGTVDLAADSKRLINKVRPLVADGGWLVALNNALFLSGAEYMAMLEELCADGYLSVEALIPVPEDFSAYAETRVGEYVVEPAPFNHPTKIAVLRVRRKGI
jgi:23S rRNA (cytosine1962-C5)-methyltransferase